MLKKSKWRYVLIILIVFVIGYIAGFSHGSYVSMSWAIDKGMYFLELNNISFDLDKEEVRFVIDSYKYKIDACYSTASKFKT